MTKRNLFQFLLLLCPIAGIGYLGHVRNQHRAQAAMPHVAAASVPSVLAAQPGAAPATGSGMEPAAASEQGLPFITADAVGALSPLEFPLVALAESSPVAVLEAPAVEPPPPVEAPASVPDLPPLPPHSHGHMAMLCAGGTVYLRGEVANEVLRERLKEKAQSVFPGMTMEMDIRLNPQCTVPKEGIDLTLRSFPSSPSETTPGLIAAALVGDHWRHAYVTSSGLAAADLPKLGLFAAETDARRVLAECERFLPTLKEHLQALNLPTTVLSR